MSKYLHVGAYNILCEFTYCFCMVNLCRIPLCALISQHITSLASKFPATKFLKSVSTSCIPNYPDKNLPTIFVYFEGDMKGQIVGPFEFGGMNLTKEGKWLNVHAVVSLILYSLSHYLNT